MNSHPYNEVILVDENDNEIGRMEKLDAHKSGVLHRAFSVLIFNDQQELLLQQRAFGKYHSEGLWTNTCCSHPGPGETILAAAHRRMKEEMGFDCSMEEVFHFIYRAELDNDLIEYELDHVVIGFSTKEPTLNTDEAIAFKWMNLVEIRQDMKNNPQQYTHWFKIILHDHFDQITTFIQHESLQTRDI